MAKQTKSSTRPPATLDLAEPLLIEKLDPLLRREVVLSVTGLSGSSLYRLVRSGDFPRPVAVSPGVNAWRQSAVGQWIADRPEAQEI